MNKDSRLVEKINHQLEKFVEVLGQGLSRPKKKFIHQMLFGIQASRDIKLSEVARSLNEDIKLLKTEMRLSRNIQDENLYLHINKKLIEHARNKIERDTVLALDLTDISKPYAEKMEFLSLVWDGINKKPILEVVGASIYEEHLYPLYAELYSQEADDFGSENKKILEAVDRVNAEVKGKGIWVIDRGGDRKILINQIVTRNLRFIIRIKPNRLLTLDNGGTKLAKEIGTELSCDLDYKLEVDNQGYKEKRKLYLGKIKVRLPGIEKELNLIVRKGFSDEPMLLLSNVEKSAVIILEMYLTRWKLEESIRFLKQEYKLEDVRVRNYFSLKNTLTLLLAVFYFLSVYLGRKLKLKILLKKIYEKAKRFFQIPVFKQYALADGIYRIFFNTKWKYSQKNKTYNIEPRQLLLSFMQE